MKVFIRILLMSMLVFISCNKGKSQEKEIFPLGDNERISYDINVGQNRENIELLIYKESKEQKEEIERYKINTYMSHVEQIGNKIYFNKRDIYDESQGGNLFLFDGAIGSLIDLDIEVVDSFCLSDDGRYLCYIIETETTDLEYYNMSLFIPGIEINDLNTGEKYTYDFQDGFLKDLFGTLVSITYNKELHRFEFGFSMDAPNNIGQGYIDISDMQYVQVKP